MTLSAREADYARYLLENWEDPKPAITLDATARRRRYTLTFASAEDESVFLESLQDEVAYDKSCGVRPTAGARLLAKLACAHSTQGVNRG